MWIDIDYDSAFYFKEEDRKRIVGLIYKNEKVLNKKINLKIKDFISDAEYTMQVSIKNIIILYLKELFDNFEVLPPEV